jgi:hypothetical protein
MYHIAPPGWTHTDPNPFTTDGSYGPGWSCFRIRKEMDSRGWNGRGPNGLFAFVVGCGWKRNLAADLADFIRYESLHGRQAIISVPSEYDAPSYIEQALAETPDWSVVRPDDPKWLVHSTTAQGWTAIQACGELRAQARLRREGANMPNLGGDWFGEPAEYTEYIILATAGAMAPEFVVASRNANRLHTEPDTPYNPGARLFFDGYRMIRDGVIVRDGLHGAKVHDHLPLDLYLVTAVTPADLDPEENFTVWTPKSFCLTALEYFADVVGEPVPYEHWE